MFGARHFARWQMPGGEAVLGGRLKYTRCRKWRPGGHGRKTCTHRSALRGMFEYWLKREEAAGLQSPGNGQRGWSSWQHVHVQGVEPLIRQSPVTVSAMI